MAEPHTLQISDRVTHPDWPEGTSRTVLGFIAGQRGGYDERGRYKVYSVPDERYARLDEPVDTGDDFPDDYWAEAGLIKL